MNIQTYSVAVRLAMDDQISRNLMMISNDAIKLNKRFIQMAKNIKAITVAANEAQRAFKGMNSAMNNQFSSATKGATAYADAMKSAANNARDVAKANQEASRASGSMLPYFAGGAMIGGALNGQYMPRQNQGPAGYIINNGRTYDGEVVRGGLSPISPLMLGYGGRGGSGGGGVIGTGGFSMPSGSGGGGLSAGGIRGWNNGVPPGGWGGGNGGGGSGGGGGNPYPGIGGHANGMTNLATGYFGFKLLDGFVDEAAKYETISEKFKQFKLGDQALIDAQKYAEAQKIKGTSDSEMLLMLTEAQGVFRQTHSLAAAKMAAPVMAKMNFAAQGLRPDLQAATTAKQMDMLRFIETAGGLKSPEKFNELMNSGFKAIQSSGGNVDFTQYRQFMAKAGTSAFNLSEKALFAELEPIIGELKGSAAGDALMTSYNRLNGIVKLPNQVTRDLMKMGVWDQSKIELNSMGGIKRFTGNPLINSSLFSQSPVDYYKQMILPIYKKQNLSEDQIQRENALIFGRTGGKMFNLIDKQLQTINHSVEMFNQSRGLEETYGAVGGTYNGKKMDFDTKWENLQLVMGKDGGLLDVFTKGLTKLTDALQRLTDIGHKYPDLTKFVGQAALAVSGLALLSGGVWAFSHAAGALYTPLKLVGWAVNSLLGVGSASSIPALATALGGLPAVITGILTAVTAYSAYEVYQWYKNGDKTDPTFKAATSAASKGGFDYNGNDPTALARYQHQINPSKYPAVPPPFDPRSTTPVNLTMTHEGRKVLIATVTDALGKAVAKPPSGVSAHDSTMNLPYPGQVSGLSTK